MSTAASVPTYRVPSPETTTLLVPVANRLEARAVDGVRVFAAPTLRDAVGLLNGETEAAPQGEATPIAATASDELDFADVRTVMQDAGSALMGIGYATGQNRAREAAERALGSPLIDAEIVHARGILLSIAGGDDLSLFEVNEAA